MMVVMEAGCGCGGMMVVMEAGWCIGILSTRKITIYAKKMWHHHLSIAIMWLGYHQCGLTTNGVVLLFI
jgi:hypothetical protein